MKVIGMKSVKFKMPNNLRLNTNYTSGYDYAIVLLEIEWKLRHVLRFTEWVNSDQGL